MGAFDRAAAARAKMAQVQREMSERRALRDRNFRQKRAESQEAFKKQGPVMAQVAKHLGELGKRRAQAGGWATEKTERDKDFHMGFGFEDEDRSKDPYNLRPTVQARPAGTDTPPGGIGALEDDDSSSRQAPPTPPPAPEAPPAPAPPRPARRPAPAREVLDDEDDFSNQSSWMRNQ